MPQSRRKNDRLFAIEDRQLRHAFWVADGLLVIRNRLFRLRHGHGLALENVRADPARYDGLIGLERIAAQVQPRMKKSLVVLASCVEVLNKAEKRCPIKVAKAGFDAAPAGSCFPILDHGAILQRALSGRRLRPSSWNLPRCKWRETVDTVQNINAAPTARRPWNKGKLVGPKPPLQPKHVWAIRTRLQMQRKVRDLALFNLAIDSKLRGCDVVSLKVEDIAPHGYAMERATVRQKKTGRPVRFEITEQSRQSVDEYLRVCKRQPGSFLFGGRRGKEKSLTTRQYARLVSNWTAMIGLDASLFGTHSLRRTKATLIYRKTGNLRAVQLLLGHSKVESTVRYLGIEVDDAIMIAEQVDI